MQNPLLWLGLSLFLVAVCLVALLLAALPVMHELARTARSAEKLLDMLSRELPPTLQSLRSTGNDLSELSEQVNEGVRSASQMVSQVDHSLETVRQQAATAQRSGLSLFVGLKAAWRQLQQPQPTPRQAASASDSAKATGSGKSSATMDDDHFHSSSEAAETHVLENVPAQPPVEATTNQVDAVMPAPSKAQENIPEA